MKCYNNGSRVIEGSDNVVAGQQQALATYTELCNLIQKEVERHSHTKKLQVVRDLPRYPVVGKSGKVKQLPKIAPAMVCGARVVEVSKADQRKEHCIEAALFLLDQGTCHLFNQYGASQYFDSLRAVSRTRFSFYEYV